MTVELSKIKTYIGFAIKSRSIKYGVDDILAQKRGFVILVSDNLAESSRNKLNNYASKICLDIIEFSSEDFKNLFNGNESIKATVITDKGLADAIKKIMTRI